MCGILKIQKRRTQRNFSLLWPRTVKIISRLIREVRIPLKNTSSTEHRVGYSELDVNGFLFVKEREREKKNKKKETL